MKRPVCLLLILALALSLTGCGKGKQSSTAFYYTRDYEADYEKGTFYHGSSDSVIVCEYRDISSRSSDLRHILSLYLRGPSSDTLVSPFPAGTYLISAEVQDSTVKIVLSSSLERLSGIDLTVACACMTMTCLELTQAASVNIRSEQPTSQGGVSVTMTADDLVLLDISTGETVPATEE